MKITSTARSAILLAAALIMLSVLAACTTEQTTTATTTATATTTTTETVSPLLVTDQIGRTVTIESVPQTIVSLAPGNTEILFALGLGDRVVGRTDYCNYPEEAASVPSIGGFSTPNIEEIVALNPDLIISANIQVAEIVPQLEGYGLTVLGLDPTNTTEVMEAITLVGKVTGVEDTAKHLVATMQSRIDAVTAKTNGISGDDIKRVLYVIWHDPFMAAGAGTFHDELIRLSGGTNIAGNTEGYPTLDMETVIGTDPQVMLAGVGMGDGQDLSLLFIQQEERLAVTSARQTGSIYSIDMDIVGRPGPRIVDALERFAACIHPELFGQ